MLEKRRWPRRKTKIPIHFEIISSGDKRPKIVEKEGVCVDINGKGFGFISSFGFKKGQVTKILLPIKGVRGVRIPLIGEVVWVKEVNSNFRGGLRFLA